MASNKMIKQTQGETYNPTKILVYNFFSIILHLPCDYQKYQQHPHPRVDLSTVTK